MLWLVLTAITAAAVAYICYVLMSGDGGSQEGHRLEDFIDDTADCSSDQPSSSPASRCTWQYDQPGRQVLILYGTEYGFSEEVAQKAFDRVLEVLAEPPELQWQPRLVNMKHHNMVDWAEEQLLLLVISTAGDGVPPTDAREFVTMLTEAPPSVSHLNYTVLANGDSNYPHFCEAGKIVDRRFSELGATPLVPRHDVDMEEGTVIQEWLDKVITALDEVKVESKMDYLQPISAEDGFCRARPFMSTIRVKRELTTRTTSTDDKETIHIEFDLTDSDLVWTSGDALGIYPENNPAEVATLLDALGCSGTEPCVIPKWAYSPQPAEPGTLHTVLLKFYDLKHVKPVLLQYLAQNVSDGSLQNSLNQLIADGLSKNNCGLHDYLYEREVADVLQEFCPPGFLHHSSILSHMRALQPRYYSISSSPVMDENTACVTAAVVHYHTLGKDRTGVTTTHLQDRLVVGQSCPVFISQNPDFRLPSNGEAPIIMIGPGTGLAPFRAFIQERVLHEAGGLNLLYFGCRQREGDYLYRQELEGWEKEQVIRLRVAFSREQAQKCYVQHLLLQDQAEIYKLIHQEGAYVYVCGDASHMAHDVHHALTEILVSQGCLAQSGAATYLLRLEKEGRYQKDVWVT